MEFIFTDQEIVLEPEDHPLYTLADRWGWWTDKGEIYVYTPSLTRIQRYGYAIHEAFEYFLTKKLGANDYGRRIGTEYENPWPHRFACIVEIIMTIGYGLTLGQNWDVLCWR